MKPLITFFVKCRWAYFHIHPGFVKFYVGPENEEAHFQNIRTGELHSNLVWVDDV